MATLNVAHVAHVPSASLVQGCQRKVQPTSFRLNASQWCSQQWQNTRLSTRSRRCQRGSLVCSAAFSPGTQSLSPEMRDALDKFVAANKVIVFMKGNRDFPQCGFSNTVVQIINTFNVPYETVNILESDSLRQGVKEYSSWPTFPQVYIDGEFFGGCDIMIETFQNGELKTALDKALVS